MTTATLQRTSMSGRSVASLDEVQRLIEDRWRMACITPSKFAGENGFSVGNSKRLMRLMDTMEEFGAILVGGEVSDHVPEGEEDSQVDSLYDLVHNQLQTVIAEALIAWAIEIEAQRLELAS
jgi:hypothetical protein